MTSRVQIDTQLFEKDILHILDTYIRDTVENTSKDILSNNSVSSDTKMLDEYIEKICYRVLSQVVKESMDRNLKKQMSSMVWYGKM